MTQLSDIEIDIKTKILRATYLNNMAVFKKYMPELANFYNDYVPTRVKLTLDHNGEVNMVSEGALVYEEHAKQQSYLQAEAFFDEPRLFSYSLSRNEERKFEHARVLETLYERREQDVKTAKFNLLKSEAQIDFLTMIGVGLGFHIERLFQLIDTRFFLLYEPDPDCMYCAMHCIDFGPIIEHCFSQGGAFTIKVGGNANQYVNGINEMMTKYGFYNVARFFNYRHYHSEATDDTFKTIYELAYRLSSGWGFFEDEMISVIHTLSNAKEKYPYLIDKKLFSNGLKDVPVFIVGNGPSLDETINFIKDNQENVVLFSCGTALKPILDAGITPDFHVEMERTAALYEWIDSVGHKEKLKQINIISLNTVYTKILRLFKKAYILSKPKDGGTDFLYEFMDIDKYPAVDACNPTVSNAATAAATYLGFDKMYLFGVDYGWIDDEHHHSKGSIYYQQGSHAERKTMDSDMSVKGNFVDQVFTTQHFDNSRAALEILLENNSEIKCYNCSNGAYIQLTHPLNHLEIESLNKVDNKVGKLEALVKDGFSFEEIEQLDLDKLFHEKLKLLKTCVDKLIEIMSKTVTSRRQLGRLFSAQFNYIQQFNAKNETRVIYRFFSGTLNYFQSNIMSNAYCYRDQNQQAKYISDAVKIFNNHLLWLYNELEQSYDKPSKN